MSSRYRRQSIHLNRASRNHPANHAHHHLSWQDHSPSDTFSRSDFRPHSGSLTSMILVPPPSIDSMRLIKGYEFVTFQPQTISPPPPTPSSPSGGVGGALIELAPLLPTSSTTPTIDSDSDNRSQCSETLSEHSTQPDNLMVKAFDLDRLPGNVTVRELKPAEARSALFQYVDNKFCYGTKAAAEMQIRDTINTFAFEYSLESFTETRQLCWTFEPYVEHANPFYPEGPIPKNAWSIDVNELKHLNYSIDNAHQPSQSQPSSPTREQERRLSVGSLSLSSTHPPKPFQNRVINIPVPGTVAINSCHNCCGSGRKKCTNCYGTGSKSCQSCAGHGFYGYKSTIGRSIDTSDFCFRCHGRGTQRCLACSGDGMLSCHGCAGTGQIKCYIRLIVTLTNHQDSILVRDHISDEIPLDLLNLAEGDIVFEEEGKAMHQLNTEIDVNIRRQSRRLIEQHRARHLNDSRLILQRHRVRMIPITKVLSAWKSHQFHFFVFGSGQHRCYTGNYPQKLMCECCCIS